MYRRFRKVWYNKRNRKKIIDLFKNNENENIEELKKEMINIIRETFKLSQNSNIDSIEE